LLNIYLPMMDAKNMLRASWSARLRCRSLGRSDHFPVNSAAANSSWLVVELTADPPRLRRLQSREQSQKPEGE
jgi:hypothetical protein